MGGAKQEIEKRSYELWEAAGRPQGRSDEFWYAAEASDDEAPIRSSAEPPAILSSAIESMTVGALWSHVFEAGSSPYAQSRAYRYALAESEGQIVLQLSEGEASVPSWGITDGYNIRVSDELEQAASGKEIVIKILARASGAFRTGFACAYSTNEVGNSGWMWREASDVWSVQEFSFAVPAMDQGNGDFLGLLPDRTNEPGVEIAAIAIGLKVGSP